MGKGKIVLKIYIADPKSAKEHALIDLQKICEDMTGFACEFEVIDATLQPEKVLKNRVLAFPTIIREEPLPLRRIIGSMSDLQQIISTLDLSSLSQESLP